MPVQQLLAFQDLPSLNSSPQSVRDAFNRHFGKEPDGIALNSETYFDAVRPAITEQYGHPCYKRLGSFSFQEGPESGDREIVVGTNYAENFGDEDAEISVTVEGSWSEQTTWSSQMTTGLTFSASFTIEGVFKMGESFSMSTTVGESSSKSTNRRATTTVTVPVPAKSRRKVEMVGMLKKEQMQFEAPITVQGMLGANFPDRVQGHYFWFLSADQVLASTSGTIQGTVENTSVLDTHTMVGKAESLKMAKAESK